ncbi:hypothetical protein SDC9_166677 [bioreactor metagenome]|uniref:Uncharacterized protein n=1 Tax=bioreactor metagenome TaxID=1076179 RepID=A0A645G078_9ZZZZ
MGAFLGIHDLQHVDIFDPAVVGFAGQYRAVADDVHLERNAVCQEPGAGAENDRQDGRVQQDAWADDVGYDGFAIKVLRHGVFG